MEMEFNNSDIVLRKFQNLEICGRYVKKGRTFDEYYFPKAEIVDYYVDKSPKRCFWLKHPNETEMLWYVQLTPGTKQFIKVINYLDPSIRNRNEILEVHKVNNKYLERQYLLKKEQKERNALCKEYKMYHFTIEKNLNDIVLNNFNWRLSGQSRGHKYGYGISFSPSACFAQQFCKSKKIKMLFVVRVLVTRAQIGKENMILPDFGFDTTVSPKNTVYVKFEDSEFYPEYIIFYCKI